MDNDVNGLRLTHLIARGFIAFVFGFACFGLTTVSVFLPRVTIRALDIVLGSYTLVDGILALVTGAWGAVRGGLWPTVVLRGLLGVATAILAFQAPMTAPQATAHVIAGWAICTGLLDFTTSTTLPHRTRTRPLRWIGGISIAFGVTLLAAADMLIPLLLFAIGVYLVLAGMLLLAFFLRQPLA